MPDTTIRVKDKTYREIIKTRGAFEKTFGYKLTLDDTMFLACAYISFAYEQLQKLLGKGLIQIVEGEGTFNVKLSGLQEITNEVLPDVVTGFQNFKKYLEEKQTVIA